MKRLIVFVFLSTFLISENLPPLEQRVNLEILPNNKALRENISAYLHKYDFCGSNIESMSASFTKNIDSAAKAVGFYNSKIYVSSISPDRSNKSSCINIKVESGPIVTFNNINISILGDMSKEDFFQTKWQTLIKQGSNLNHKDYEIIKDIITQRAQEMGYFDGDFIKKELLINPEINKADVNIVFDSGQRYRFKNIVFEGDDILNQDLLLKYVPFQVGDYYHSSKVESLYNNIQSSNYYSGVFLDTDYDRQNAEVLVKANLTERLTRTFNLGLGYSTDVGPRIRFGFTKYLVNRRGHNFYFDSSFSKPKQVMNFAYDMPWNKPLTDKIRADLYYKHDTTLKDGNYTKFLRVGPEFITLNKDKWIQNISLKYFDEKYKLGGEYDHSKLFILGFKMTKVYADNLLNPNKGYNFSFEILGSHNKLGSTQSLLYTNINLKALDTYFENHKLILRTHLGATFASKDVKVPYYFRFFTGGDGSVRGYKYQSISPVNEYGDKLGGTYLVTGSSEYQYKINSSFRIATFFDAGNSFNDRDKIHFKKGAGLGLRYISPLGPISLDFAYPISKDTNYKKDWKIHFSIGSDL